jgi:hypothetical protein
VRNSAEFCGSPRGKLHGIPKDILELVYFGDMETWKHGVMDMETWRLGDMETWRHEIWRRGNMETWKHGVIDKKTWKQEEMKT